MRILHIGKYFWPTHGGIENFLLDLVRASTGPDVRQACLVHAAPGQPTGWGKPDFPFLDGLYRVPVYGHLSYAPISPGILSALENMLERFRPDLLHFHLPNTSAFAALFSRHARRLPWLIHWHSDVVGPGLDLKLKLLYPFYRPFEQAMLRRARTIIATSPPYLESSRALTPWRAKCTVIPLGLDPARICPDRTEPGQIWADHGKLRILAVGRLTPYKGFQALLETILKFPDAELKIVGDGELMGELRRQLRAAGQPDQIELLGAVTDQQRNRLLADCDLVCLPSINRGEAFGMILLEAMAAAKPVLATNVPGSGMGWVVEDGVTGWLCPPNNPEALQSALSVVLRCSRTQLHSMGQAGLERFRANFDSQAVSKVILRLQRSTLQGSSPHS